MRKPILAGAIFCSTLLMPWAVLAQEATSEETTAEAEAPKVAYDVDSILATVNGVDITLGHVVLQVQKLPEQYQTAPDDVLYSSILEQLIDQYLLAETMPKGEALSAVVRIAIENETRAILASNMIGDIAGREITEEAIAAFHEEQFGDVAPQQEVHASHILVVTEDDAKEIVSALDDGADFIELAKEKSTGPSAPNGGDLGWFSRGSMVPEFEDAVFALEVGKVSGPVQTQFGWHVITLNETREVLPPSLEEVRDQLIGQLRQKAVQDEIDTLRSAAQIEMKNADIPATAVRDTTILEQ